jgi:hypothetical protein
MIRLESDLAIWSIINQLLLTALISEDLYNLAIGESFVGRRDGIYGAMQPFTGEASRRILFVLQQVHGKAERLVKQVKACLPAYPLYNIHPRRALVKSHAAAAQLLPGSAGTCRFSTV